MKRVLQKLLAKFPHANKVEVIRCKRCKSWERNVESSDSYGTCYCHGFNRGILKHENGYCDQGKEKAK